MDVAGREALQEGVLNMHLFLFLAVGFGVSNAIAYLRAFEWLRKVVSGLSDVQFEYSLKDEGETETRISVIRDFFGHGIRCHACIGFWIGMILSMLAGSVSLGGLTDCRAIAVVADGLLLSASNFVLWTVLSGIGAKDL